MNDYWLYALLIVAGFFIVYKQTIREGRVYRRIPKREFPLEWRTLLVQSVPFYNKLSNRDRTEFEKQVHTFLLNYQIIGKNTTITHKDRVLIAAGGVIPTFRFKNWHYATLKKIILFPDKFTIPETDKMARGLVGRGAMEGQMWLSRKALYQGFDIDTDQINVAIHEFIHLVDMQDGIVDGVLVELMSDADVEKWMHIVKSHSLLIEEGESSVRDYAKTNPVEFLAAVGEYFFESPAVLQSNHPDLYRILDRVFNAKEYN